MNNIIALKRPEAPREAVLHYARIAGQDSAAYLVRLDNGEYLSARRAGGCLLVPEIGDKVLIADNGSRAFILIVLSREEERGRVTLPETCEVAGGEINFTGRKGMAWEAPRVTLTGIVGEARFQGLSLFSRWCDVRSRKIVAVAEIWDRVVGRLTERIRDSYRRIENAEQTTAGRIRTIVRGRFSLKAENADINATEDVKIDGKQIHLG